LDRRGQRRPGPLTAKEEMFSERISLLFKKLRVVRMVDARRNAPVYMTLFRPHLRRLAAEQRDGGGGGPRHADSRGSLNARRRRTLRWPPS